MEYFFGNSVTIQFLCSFNRLLLFLYLSYFLSYYKIFIYVTYSHITLNGSLSLDSSPKPFFVAYFLFRFFHIQSSLVDFLIISDIGIVFIFSSFIWMNFTYYAIKLNKTLSSVTPNRFSPFLQHKSISAFSMSFVVIINPPNIYNILELRLWFLQGA